MPDTTIEASAPALVLVFSNPFRPQPDAPIVEEKCDEEHNGNVFVGLKYAMIIYLALAVGIASAWKLCHLL
jgi:hypothetical protein